MSKWVLVFLCCFAANAFASSADSGRCPWKIPFTITIHSAGGLHHYISNSTDQKEYPNTDYGTEPDTFDNEITVDTSMSYWESGGNSNIILQYSLNGGILRFSISYNDTVFSPISVTKSTSVTFAPGEDSIITLTSEDNETYYQTGAMPEISRVYSFQIFSLLFDDTSIFTTDASFSGHNISNTYFETDDYYPIYNDNKDFTASSFDLSGIFRPMHFADQPPAIVDQSTAQSDPIAVTFLNGALQCSFGASSDERTLEIFSVVGIKSAGCSVLPGGTEAVVPHISPGFYFVRLGCLMAKVYVAE